MASKTARFIVTPQPIIGPVAYHDYTKLKPEERTLKRMMDSSLVPEADMTVRGGWTEVKNGPQASFVEPHIHEVSQMYIILGDLTAEVSLDGERHELTAPACVFIPAGMMHTIRMLKGSGYFLGIMRAGEYE